MIKLAGKNAYFPSPEDLIILKVVVGREKDMLDAKSILIRHKNKLDRKYMEKWAQSISNEAQDKREILKYGAETEVLKPLKLKKEIIEEIKEMKKIYQ